MSPRKALLQRQALALRGLPGVNAGYRLWYWLGRLAFVAFVRLTERRVVQAVYLRRNPHYWRIAEDGVRLPRVDGLRLDIVPSQDAEMLRLRNGEADVTTAELRPDDLPEARALAARQQLQLFDLGPSLETDMLWFNLAANAPGGERRAWLRRRELREAVAHAVDRAAFVNAVYRGAAGLQLCVESPTGIIASERFALRPRAVARMRALRDSLLRRGWREFPGGV